MALHWSERTRRLNNAIAKSCVGRWFQLDGSGHVRERKNAVFTTEVRAGLATFFAMAYIIAVNANIVTDSGGTCVCNGGALDPFCKNNAQYDQCLVGLKQDLVTATAAISAIATFFFGLLANLPLGLSTGLGLNSYFTYTVVGYHGSGPVPYRLALTAVFVEGFIFIALSLLGLRQWLARSIPHCIKLATGAGIGLYLTLIGFTYSAGLGLTVGSQGVPLELAGCPASTRDPITGVCPSEYKMRSPVLWMGVAGAFIISTLLMYRIKGAMVIGILAIAITSWPRNSPITYFPYTPDGQAAFDFFKQVVSFHPMRAILAAQQWDIGGASSQFGLAIITFLFTDILDCTGTMTAMSNLCGVMDPDTGDFEGSTMAFLTDATSITIGSLFGVPPITVFVESGAGIAEGGRTGITAMVIGLCFFVSIFFAPILASLPPWSTGPALIIVGSMMTLNNAKQLNTAYIGEALPAFLVMAVTPLTASIAYGLIAGICSYILLNGFVFIVKYITRGQVVPVEYDTWRPWSWRIKGSLYPSWIARLIRRGRHEPESLEAKTID